MVIVVHYGEIGVKGKNRKQFEEKLMSNLRTALKVQVKRQYGRIIIESANAERLSLIPGIKYFSYAEECTQELDEIKRKAVEILKNRNFETFRVETKRSNKSFPFKSMEINTAVGEEIRKKLNKKVDLKNPDLKLYIEITEKDALLYTQRYEGVGGLPVGTAGKLVAMLSGGIDSPVASFMMMKRGCSVVLAHYMSSTQVTEEAIKKVKELASKLNRIQLRTRLYIIPFIELQKEIIKNVPARFRMIVYRRYMTRITNLIVRKEKAKGIVTGDSIGQVASQTLNNLSCIYDAADFPVFSPLIGLNKVEIIQIARKINTYETSILPYQDCCSFMVAEHPETSAKLDVIKSIEENIDDSLIKKSFEAAKKYDILC